MMSGPSNGRRRSAVWSSVAPTSGAGRRGRGFRVVGDASRMQSIANATRHPDSLKELKRRRPSRASLERILPRRLVRRPADSDRESATIRRCLRLPAPFPSRDLCGIRHLADVHAESLFQAVVLAVKILRITRGSTSERAEPLGTPVSMQPVRWLDGRSTTRARLVKKAKSKSPLMMRP